MIYTFKKYIRELSYNNVFIEKIYSFANILKIKLLSKLNDESFAKLKYKENTGEKLNLDNPVTFNEKLWWLKINNRDPLLTTCSDKYKVRDYVKDCGLSHILTEIYGVYDNADDINFKKMPDKAFIKCNHGSGTNILYDKNKEFNINKFRKRFNKALKQNYYFQSREWNYKDIKPKIIIEEVLQDDNNCSPLDYKFLCFDGKVKLLFVDINVASEDGSHNPYAQRNLYDIKFNLLNMKIGRENFDPNLIKRPKNFDRMIKYAELLSEPFPHCRVDLYNINGRIYFGEMTFYTGGATQKITPLEWDLKLGSWVNLESSKIHVQ